jgi:hypothetical protein
MRTIKSLLNNFIVNFMMYFIFYILVSLFINHKTYPTQGVNDDEFFAQLVSGEFTGSRESFTHISPASPQWFFGFLLTKFYLIDPNISWYYLILLITVLISLTFMTIIVTKKSHLLNQEKILLSILSITFLLWFVPSPTYTSTAFISSLAGVVGFVIGIRNKYANFYFLFPSIFLTWGMSIRTESFYATLLFFIPTIILWLLITRNFDKFLVQKSFIIMALPLMVFTLNLFKDYENFSQPDWKEYRIFNEPRYAIQDNEAERVISKNPMEFGWTDTEYRLFKKYNFISLESFSGQKLKTINDKYAINSRMSVEINLEDLRKRWSTYFGPFYSVIYSSFFIFFYFVLSFFLRRESSNAIKFIILSICTLIFNGILLIGITTFLRLPERIVFPIAWFFPLSILLLATLFKNEDDKFQFKMKSVLNLFCMAIFFIAILLPSINHLYSLKINPAYTSFWGQQKLFYEKVAGSKVLVGNASQFKSIWSNPYLKRTENTNLSIYPLGWYTFSPYWTQRGKLFGINESAIGHQLVDNPNLLWVSDDEVVKDLIALISTQKSSQIDYEKLDSISFDYRDYNIYSLVENP